MRLESWLSNHFKEAFVVSLTRFESVKKLLQETRFDLVVLDLINRQTERYASLLALVRLAPESRYFVRSSSSPQIFAPWYRLIGASAFVHSSASEQSFLQVVADVLHSKQFFPVVLEANQIVKLRETSSDHCHYKLDDLELEIASFLIDGKSFKEICSIIGLPHREALSIAARVYQKLEVKSLIDHFNLTLVHDD